MSPEFLVQDLKGAPLRPVVRGPQRHVLEVEASLKHNERARAEKAFHLHNKASSSVVDFITVASICESLELPLDCGVSKAWLHGLCEDVGVSLEDFLQLYGRILAAQTPAVRKAMESQHLRFPEMRSTEGQDCTLTEVEQVCTQVQLVSAGLFSFRDS